MLETEGPTLKLVQGHHGSITRVAFSPDSSHFTVVWQEFEAEPTLSFNVYSRACQRLACFEDEAVLIDAPLASISGNRLAVAHLGACPRGNCSPVQSLSPSLMACSGMEARSLPIKQAPSWSFVQPSLCSIPRRRWGWCTNPKPSMMPSHWINLYAFAPVVTLSPFQSMLATMTWPGECMASTLHTTAPTCLRWGIFSCSRGQQVQATVVAW